ncbi:dienelactone hydrolase family protein [Jatrophihabitans sp. YIM 134969]
MAEIALFHSVLGVRDGVRAAADLLRDAGHDVTVVDQYDGRVFDDYDQAKAYAEGERGYPALTAAALAAVADRPDSLVVAGFSNGGAMAEWVATHRPVAAALLFSGVVPLADLTDLEPGLRWPVGVPVQTHYARHDPFLREGRVEAFTAEVEAAGGVVESHWYEGSGHLFTDASLPAEYEPEASDLQWERVLGFLERLGPDGLEALDDVV